MVSPTQWAERAEQKARERIQPLLDEAQVIRYNLPLLCAGATFSLSPEEEAAEGNQYILFSLNLKQRALNLRFRRFSAV